MKDLLFNYVYFVSPDDNKLKDNPNGYYTICTQDLETSDSIKRVSYPLCHKNKLIRLLFAIHTSRKINSRIKLPFQTAWYPYYFKANFQHNKQLCFVVEGTHIPLSYITYCKKKFKGCVFVKIHRDLMKFSEITNPEYTEENINKYFDYRLSYDQEEAAKYNCEHFDEFESIIDVPRYESFDYDVYFAGKAKDRLNLLIDLYDKLDSCGLKCHFFITKAKKAEQKTRSGIVYSDKPISYKRMLIESMKAKCLLDINQLGAVGYTSRFLEGVMYDKLILTNNPAVKKSKFYKYGYILYFEKPSDINVDFFNNKSDVNYHYNNEFSPIRLIEKIDKLIGGQK